MEGALAGVQHPDPSTFFIRGVVGWRNGNPEEAIKSWNAGLERFGPRAISCAYALQAVGENIYFEAENTDVAAMQELLSQ